MTPRYYWTVNGDAACQSDLTCDERLDPPTVCAHASLESVEAEVARFAALHPEAEVKIVEGYCRRTVAGEPDDPVGDRKLTRCYNQALGALIAIASGSAKNAVEHANEAIVEIHRIVEGTADSKGHERGEGAGDYCGIVYNDTCGCPKCEALADRIDNGEITPRMEPASERFIAFDRAKLAEFRALYDDAVEDGAGHFVFEGRVVLTAYAKYAIEYLTQALPLVDPGSGETH
jgi:hypothetical protein